MVWRRRMVGREVQFSGSRPPHQRGNPYTHPLHPSLSLGLLLAEAWWILNRGCGRRWVADQFQAVEESRVASRPHTRDPCQHCSSRPTGASVRVSAPTPASPASPRRAASAVIDHLPLPTLLPHRNPSQWPSVQAHLPPLPTTTMTTTSPSPRPSRESPSPTFHSPSPHTRSSPRSATATKPSKTSAPSYGPARRISSASLSSL